jgi:hypothetical protein
MNKIYWAGFIDGQIVCRKIRNNLVPTLYETERSARRFNSEARRVQVLEYFDVPEEMPKRLRKAALTQTKGAPD